MEVIATTPKYLIIFTVSGFAAMVLTLRLLFLFHYFILEGMSFWDAARASFGLTRGHSLTNAANVLYWKFRCNVVYGIAPAVLVLLVYLICGYVVRDYDAVSAAGDVITANILTPTVHYVSDCFTTSAVYTYFGVLFRHYRNEQGEQTAELPEEIEAGGKRSFRLLAPAIYGAVSAVSLALMLTVSVLFKEDPEIAAMLIVPTTITSHRGYSSEAPENTLPAFEAAIESGCVDYAELDVQETSDGVVVVTHDTNLKRCTGRNVNVYDLTYAELLKLDAGSYFSEAFKDTKIPTLAEVMELADGKIRLNIEIKTAGSHMPELEKHVVEVIHEHDFSGQCIITSLDYTALEKVKELDPELRTGYILAMGAGCYYDLPAADLFSIESTFVTRNMVREIHKRGKEVHTWTIDKEENAVRMVSLGVDSLITGKPELIYNAAHSSMSHVESFVRDNLIDIGQFMDHEQVYGFDPEEVNELLEGA